MGCEDHRQPAPHSRSASCEAYRLGAAVFAGSDAGSYGVAHCLGLLDEMVAMERAELHPIAVIHGSARFGRDTSGYLPRLLLTSHSPLDRMANLRKPMTVVYGGRALRFGAAIEVRGL